MDRIRVKGSLGLVIEGTEEDPLKVTYRKEIVEDGKPSKRKPRVPRKPTKDGVSRE